MFHFIAHLITSVGLFFAYAALTFFLAIGALYSYFELHFLVRKLASAAKWLSWLTVLAGKLSGLTVFAASLFLVLQVHFHWAAIAGIAAFWAVFATFAVVAIVHLVHIYTAVRDGLKTTWTLIKRDAHRA